MTRDEFSRCIALIRSYWPHGASTWTADVIQAWESLLLDLEAVHVAAAIQVLAADGREWPPPPGLVRQRVSDLARPLPSGDEAWGEVREQLRAVGSTRGMMDFTSDHVIQPVWSHPLVGEIADRLGWDELCMSENQMADRAHFLRLWEDARGRTRLKDALPPAARQALAERGVALPDLRVKEVTS